MKWLRSLIARVRPALERLREWACEDANPPETTVDRAAAIGVTLMASPLGPPRAVVRVTTADGTVRLLVLTPLQAELLSRQLKAAVFAGCPLRP